MNARRSGGRFNSDVGAVHGVVGIFASLTRSVTRFPNARKPAWYSDGLYLSVVADGVPPVMRPIVLSAREADLELELDPDADADPDPEEAETEFVMVTLLVELSFEVAWAGREKRLVLFFEDHC